MTMEQGISNETRQKKQGPEGQPVPLKGELREEHLAWGALEEGGGLWGVSTLRQPSTSPMCVLGDACVYHGLHVGDSSLLLPCGSWG